MPRIDMVSKEDIPSELKEDFDVIERSNGYIPNSYLILAHRPSILKAYMDLAKAVIRDEGTVDRGLKFLVAYISSRAAGCFYCQAHNLRSAARWGVPDEKLAVVWDFDTNPTFNATERAALNFARAATLIPNLVTDELMHDLKEHFTNEQIVEILSVVSLFGWNNRFNDSAATFLDIDTYDWAEGFARRSGNGWHGSGVRPPAGTKLSDR